MQWFALTHLKSEYNQLDLNLAVQAGVIEAPPEIECTVICRKCFVGFPHPAFNILKFKQTNIKMCWVHPPPPRPLSSFYPFFPYPKV